MREWRLKILKPPTAVNLSTFNSQEHHGPWDVNYQLLEILWTDSEGSRPLRVRKTQFLDRATDHGIVIQVVGITRYIFGVQHEPYQ